jgi:transketolase
MTDKELEQFAKAIRKRILKMAYECGSNVHIGGALSMTDIIAVLYGNVLKNYSPEMPYEVRDKFILSKGHGAIALFATLGELDILTEEELASYLQDGSNLCAHPVMDVSHGIESSNGSLGQGISMAVGVALSAKRKKRGYHTYTIIGNGESDEGIVWEALASAVQFGLDNLTVILDDNKFQNDGASEDIMYYPNYAQRLESFGFDVIEVDGNKIPEVREALQKERVQGKPRAIVADTIKGKGISFMENDNTWHHNRLTLTQYNQAMEELNA